MESLLFSFIFGLCATSAFASMGLEIVEPVEGHPNQCFVKENKAFYDVNESWQLKECGIGSCSTMNIRGKQRFLISYTGCGAVHAEPPCYIRENKNLSYPDCCPDIVCPEFEETDQTENRLNGKFEDSDINDNLISSEYDGRFDREAENDLFGYKDSSAFKFY
jgi:hypothetical protein